MGRHFYEIFRYIFIVYIIYYYIFRTFTACAPRTNSDFTHTIHERADILMRCVYVLCCAYNRRMSKYKINKIIIIKKFVKKIIVVEDTVESNKSHSFYIIYIVPIFIIGLYRIDTYHPHPEWQRKTIWKRLGLIVKIVKKDIYFYLIL